MRVLLGIELEAEPILVNKQLLNTHLRGAPRREIAVKIFALKLREPSPVETPDFRIHFRRGPPASLQIGDFRRVIAAVCFQRAFCGKRTYRRDKLLEGYQKREDLIGEKAPLKTTHQGADGQSAE